VTHGISFQISLPALLSTTLSRAGNYFYYDKKMNGFI